MNWVYGIIKALLDWLRETPPPTVEQGKAPADLKAELDAAIDAASRRMQQPGDPRP